MTTRSIWPCCVRRLSWTAALGAMLVAGAAAADEPTLEEIEYHPAELPPDGARARAILVGAALTAGWYGASVGTSYLWSEAPNARDLRLPVVGPWLALGDVGCGRDEATCSTGVVIARTTIAVISGVGQAGGLFAILEGLLMDTASSKAPSAKSERDSVASGASWAAAPLMLPDGAGVELVGRF